MQRNNEAGSQNENGVGINAWENGEPHILNVTGEGRDDLNWVGNNQHHSSNKALV